MRNLKKSLEIKNMTREEAINEIKSWDFLEGKEIEAIHTLIPELAESEDKRIRKDIIGGLMWQRDNLKSEGPHDNNLILPGFCFAVGKHLAYLEKQKELSELGKYIADKRSEIGFYCNHKEVSWNEIPLEDRKHDYPYYFDGDIDCYPFVIRKQKEQKHSVDTEIQVTKNDSIAALNYEFLRLCKAYEIKLPFGRPHDVYHLCEDLHSFMKQKEQKPAEWSEKYIADVFEKVGLAKIVREQGNDGLTNAVQSAMIELSKVGNAEWSEEDETVEMSPYEAEFCQKFCGHTPDYYTSDGWKIIKKDYAEFKEIVMKELKQGWSEEDEKMLQSIIDDFRKGHASTIGQDCWLKSLHPSWKPSELEKGALRTAIHVLTEERSFPKAAEQLQNILDAFDGKESRQDWKPSDEQIRPLEYAIEYFKKKKNDVTYLESLYQDLLTLRKSK